MSNYAKLTVLGVLAAATLTLTNCAKDDAKPSITPTTPTVTIPSAITYSPSTITLSSGEGGTSITPTVNGTSPFTFSLTVTPNATGFSIGSNGAVTIPNTLSEGTYTISVTASNSAGQSTNATALTVVVRPTVTPPPPTSKITYEQVRPILQANCGSCHAEFLTYNTARGKANQIATRIQLQPSQAGFMPQGGTSLPDNQINLIKQWISDGLLEK
jgi:hypothetical protein